jgi:hypothetical protein
MVQRPCPYLVTDFGSGREDSYDSQRESMVGSQIEARGITDPDVLPKDSARSNSSMTDFGSGREDSYDSQRESMVGSQIEARGITDPDVLPKDSARSNSSIRPR